jgi:hypothetical protein
MGEYAFLAVYRSSYGMALPDLWARGNGMLGAWLILGVEWVLFMAAAWYLEQVFASGTGNRRHPLFFLAGLKRALLRCCGRAPSAAAGGDSGDSSHANGTAGTAAAEAAAAATPRRAANPLQSLLHKSPRRGGSVSSDGVELQLPRHSSPTPASAGSDSPLRGATPSMVDAGVGIDATSGTVVDSAGSYVEPDDVGAERLRVAGLDDYEGNPIVIRSLNKTYPGMDGQPPKVRVGARVTVCAGARACVLHLRCAVAADTLSNARQLLCQLCCATKPPTPPTHPLASWPCARWTWPLSAASASGCWAPTARARARAST